MSFVMLVAISAPMPAVGQESQGIRGERVTIMDAEAMVDHAAQGQVPKAQVTYPDPAFFAVSVSNLEASVLWYTRVLGLDTVRSVVSSDGRSRAIVLRRDGLVVELIGYRGSVGFTQVQPSPGHRFGLQGLVKAEIFVPDIEAFHAHLMQSDVNVDQRIIEDTGLNQRAFVFRDPDGNQIQVFAIEARSRESS